MPATPPLLKKIRQGLFGPSKTAPVPSSRFAPRFASLEKEIKQLETATKCKIKDPLLMEEALTHRSLSKAGKNNERLEFLGDAVLDLVTADILMKKYPEDSEGDLTKKRSRLVSGPVLAEIAEKFGFHRLLRAVSEEHKRNPRLLAGVLEAWIGAIYREGGLSEAEKLIKSLFHENINKENFTEQNHKSFLQEWCQRKYNEIPVYKLKKEEGLEHKKTFVMEVFIKDVSYGTGQAREKKKEAEQAAARQALQQLNIPIGNPLGSGAKNQEKPGRGQKK